METAAPRLDLPEALKKLLVSCLSPVSRGCPAGQHAGRGRRAAAAAPLHRWTNVHRANIVEAVLSF